MTTDSNASLLRYLLDRLANAIDCHDGEATVTVLKQIRSIDADLGDQLLNGLLRIGMHRLLDHLTDAIARHDGDTVVATLAQIRAIDRQAAAELTNHLSTRTIQVVILLAGICMAWMGGIR